MKIQAQNNFYIPNFKAATININAFSDTHGELLYANKGLEELRKRKADVFEPQEKGKVNILTISGDWFMDGGRKGYLTNPTKPNGMFQLDILNVFLEQIKKFVPNNITLFTPGNHEFDGGVPLLAEIFQKLNAQTIISNLDIENSPAFKDSIKDGKLVSQKVLEVEDDKEPSLKHKVLFLGITPVNLVSYQQNLNGVTLTNNVEKAQNKVQPEDYKETLEECKKRITEFKKENPKGLVVLMSHTGVNFADNLARESSVDLVLDGHEHKEDIRIVNGTQIVPLSQNFQRMVNAKFKLDDDGNLDSLNIKTYSPLGNRKKGALFRYYHTLFKQDIKKIYSIRTSNAKAKNLDTQNIRTENNFLANFVTDAIHYEIRRKDPSVDFFALNSSAIRRPLKISMNPTNSSFDVFNVLSGIKDEDGQIMTTSVNGRELAYLIMDNVVFNKEAPNKNPLIHYSGLIIDKTKLLEAVDKGEPLDSYLKFITDIRTGQPIKADKTYKIANVEKYFNKNENGYIKSLKEKSKFLGPSIQELFRQHFVESNGVLHAKCDVRYK